MKRVAGRLRLPRRQAVVGLLCCLAGMGATGTAAPALAQAEPFQFGVIGHAGAPGATDALLRDAIAATDADNLAFVVVAGVKAAAEPCTDKLYFHRKEMFQSAKNGLIVSIAAGDWSECRDARGQSIAIERLSRVRDLFFADEFSFGASRLPLMHQASTPKYRTYTENLRWDVGNMAFATVNLPANNNDYLAAAGRNSEFEDRMIADRDWLHRVVSVATQRQAAGIVLFCDADPVSRPDLLARIGFGSPRDGFAEIRKQLKILAQRFAGKILLVHASPATTGGGAINWEGRLGTVAVPAGWLKIAVDPHSPAMFNTVSTATVLHTAGQ